MYPIYHFVLSIVLSGFLWPILGWKLVFFWLGSFFIDVDHYWWYILKFRDFSLENAYKYCESLSDIRKFTHKDFALHMLHTVDFLVLMGIWSLFSELAFIIFLGLVYHSVIDFIYLLDTGRFDGRSLFFLEWIYRFGKIFK